MMIHRNILKLAFISLSSVIVLSLLTAHAANISVPATRLTDQVNAITANTLKPASCSTLVLTSVVVCTGGNCNGTNANELLLGTSEAERIRGRGGSDCILGGGGGDELVGNGKSDVCIGGPGFDDFLSCEATIQ